MIVCKRCLAAIESHEGYQKREPLIHSKYYDEERETQICEWCEEDELQEEMVVI